MKILLIVGLGGFCGAAARYQVSVWFQHFTAEGGFPLATLTVNILGCLLVGLIGGLAEGGQVGHNLRFFLITGILGGFTTFSAFGFETLHMIRRGLTGPALLYISLSLIGGVMAAWGGFALSRLWIPVQP